jgi:hypothetical protein
MLFVPEGWRLLEKGETICEGDMLLKYGYKFFQGYTSFIYDPYIHTIFIRKIEEILKPAYLPAYLLLNDYYAIKSGDEFFDINYAAWKKFSPIFTCDYVLPGVKVRREIPHYKKLTVGDVIKEGDLYMFERDSNLYKPIIYSFLLGDTIEDNDLFIRPIN